MPTVCHGTEPLIAVTGLGAVTAWGWDLDALWRALRRGETSIGTFDRFDAERHRTRHASQVPAPPEGTSRAVEAWDRLTLADRFAVVAAREAVTGAGLGDRGRGPIEWNGRRVGIYFGVSTGGMFESERYFAGLRDHTVRKPPIATIASQEINGPSEAVARDLGIDGPVETVSTACASGGMAVGMALDALRDGEVDIALAGGADALCELTFAGFNALRAVDADACRPFRAGRAGMSLGEGGAVLVLERRDEALARGTGVHAYLLGAGASCDAHHMTAPQASGEGPSEAIVAALDDAGVGPEAIDFVNAHGTGTAQNDRAEAAALHRIFGDRTSSLPLTSTKGSVGHLLGCAGALEALVTVLCLEHGEVHPTPGEPDSDPDLEVDLVTGTPRPIAARHALSSSLAFGGANAAVVFAHAGEA